MFRTLLTERAASWDGYGRSSRGLLFFAEAEQRATGAAVALLGACLTVEEALELGRVQPLSVQHHAMERLQLRLPGLVGIQVVPFTVLHRRAESRCNSNRCGPARKGPPSPRGRRCSWAKRGLTASGPRYSQRERMSPSMTMSTRRGSPAARGPRARPPPR